MSAAKIVLSILYIALLLAAITQGDSPLGEWSLRILIILAVVHAIEVAVFFRRCQQAGGSLPMHLLNVFLFGIIHANEIKAAQGSGQAGP